MLLMEPHRIDPTARRMEDRTKGGEISSQNHIEISRMYRYDNQGKTDVGGKNMQFLSHFPHRTKKGPKPKFPLLFATDFCTPAMRPILTPGTPLLSIDPVERSKFRPCSMSPAVARFTKIYKQRTPGKFRSQIPGSTVSYPPRGKQWALWGRQNHNYPLRFRPFFPSIIFSTRFKQKRRPYPFVVFFLISTISQTASLLDSPPPFFVYYQVSNPVSFHE